MTPPAFLVAAFWDARESGDAEANASIAWEALLDRGQRMNRIGRAFYDDAPDEGQRVLVVPLENA